MVLHPVRHSYRLFFSALVCAAILAPAPADAQAIPRGNGRALGQIRLGYDRGFEEGRRQGEQDARRGRTYGFDRDPAFRDGDRGYSARSGNREVYRDQFRRGFADGYRSGYDSVRGSSYRQYGGNDRRDTSSARRLPGGYQEPAFARGYADGYEEGVNDARGRDSYDPVGSRDYRDGDQGYYGSYGSRDAYKNNYRAGFRQGYEDGYRGGRR